MRELIGNVPAVEMPIREVAIGVAAASLATGVEAAEDGDSETSCSSLTQNKDNKNTQADNASLVATEQQAETL